MSGEVYTINEIAVALGICRRAAHRRADRGGWPREKIPGRGGAFGYPLESLPLDLQAVLLMGRGVVLSAELAAQLDGVVVEMSRHIAQVRRVTRQMQSASRALARAARR